MSSTLPLFAAVEGAWLDKFTDVVNLVDDKVWGTSFEIAGFPFLCSSS